MTRVPKLGDLNKKVEAAPRDVREGLFMAVIILATAVTLTVGGTSLWWLSDEFARAPITWLLGLVHWSLLVFIGGLLFGIQK